MISLDTNILVRLLTNDDPRQAQKARAAPDQALQDQHHIWVSLVVTFDKKAAKLSTHKLLQ